MSDTDSTNPAASPLVEHAIRELTLAGVFTGEADYGPALAEHIVALVRLFATGGHSGGSAEFTIDVLTRLLRWKTLTPVTSDPAEWNDIGELGPERLWQNRRCPSTFSRDGGQTWFDLDGQKEQERGQAEVPPPFYLDIVLDHAPNGESPVLRSDVHHYIECLAQHFVEVEDPDRASVTVGTWIERGDGHWALRIPFDRSKLGS